MTTGTIGIIGGGRVTRILLQGWQRAKALPAKIVVTDCNKEAFAMMQAQFPSIETARVRTRRWRRRTLSSWRQVGEMYRTRLPALFQKIRP